ncbi:DNA-directed RNA polymerase II [Burkholderia contaminans]|nr:DNA-directed RNA polymerase II [Burkholderia contaminans]VWD30713.1 DNA-directed RNA polymerase II [Burkholderia contaminans]
MATAPFAAVVPAALPAAVLLAPIVTAPVPFEMFGSPIATAPSPLAVWPRPIATAPPEVEPLFAFVPDEPIATFWPVAPEVTPSPCAMPYAPLTVAPRPSAIPDVAVDATDDCPPIAMPSEAADCAPFVALLPIAIEPAPDASVEFACESGVVPLPPAPPIATEFSALAVEPKPSAVAPAPLAVVSRPAATPHKPADDSIPVATAPLPVACANEPYTVTPVQPLPLELHPATTEYVPEPSPAWFCVPPGFTRPTAPVLPVKQVCCVLSVLASASPGRLIASAATAATTTADLFGLPRAESISDAATHAPRASFQIERYVRFMSCYLQICTPHTGLFC